MQPLGNPNEGSLKPAIWTASLLQVCSGSRVRHRFDVGVGCVGLDLSARPVHTTRIG